MQPAQHACRKRSTSGSLGTNDETEETKGSLQKVLGDVVRLKRYTLATV